METNRDTAELIARVIVVEKQLSDNEKYRDNISNQIVELTKKVDEIKEDIRHHRDIPEIRQKLISLELELNTLKMSVNELNPFKKIISGFIAFILMAFIGLIWNNLVVNKPVDYSDLTKKLIQEYNKTNEK